MKNLLKQMANNTKTKISSSVVVRDNKTRFKTWYKPPIQLDKKKYYEIALINLETYNSFPNIDRSNNCFTYAPGQTHHGLTLLFLRVVITLKILMNSFIDKSEKMATMIKQTIRMAVKYFLIPTN